MKKLSPARHRAIKLLSTNINGWVASITLKWLIKEGYVEVIETRRKSWVVYDYRLTLKGKEYDKQ